MPWYMPCVPEGIKKRVCIYLLQRYLGQFFEEKLRLDQLSINLYNGTGTVADVSLDVQALNDLGENQNWPLEFVDGYLEELFISVPWTSLLSDSTYIQVRGLKLTVQPKQRKEPATSMFDNMWSSMSNSMQLAEDCMKQEAAASVDTSPSYDGIVKFAETIDSILSRVKVKFTDTVIQIEHVPKDCTTGVGIQINIDVMEYSDEAGEDPPIGETTDINNQEQNKTYLVSSFTCKNFTLEGVTLSTVEFPSRARTFSRSIMGHSSASNVNEEQTDSLTTLLQNTNINNTSNSTDSENDDGGHIEMENYLDKKEVNDEKDKDERSVVIFGKLLGKQEIKVKLKQTNTMVGPKVSLEINLGSLILFMSPRQIHILIELASGFARPDLEDTSNIAPRQKCVEKKMTELDYERIEQELQQNLNPLSYKAAGLQGIHGWSTAPLEESDDEKFLPMRSETNVMYDSTLSNASSSMDSSISSSMASSFTDQSTRPRSRRRGFHIDTDPTAEISRFQIRLASLAAIILHEDFITLSCDTQNLIPSSVQQMQNTAASFFQNLGLFTITGYSNKDFNNTRKLFEKTCKLNHIRLLGAPIQIEGDETTTTSAFSISCSLTAARLEILECLHQGAEKDKVDYIPLLSFTDSVSIGSPLVVKPCFKMVLNHIEQSLRTGVARKQSTKSDIGISLESCTIELDITIVDRINALLNPYPVCIVNRPKNIWNVNSNEPLNIVQSDTKTDIKITAPHLNIRLRFPVPDFRPPHDMQKIPWWKRNIRSDYVSIKLHEAVAQTTLFTNQPFSKYTILAKTVNLFYYENDNSTPVDIGKVGFYDDKPSHVGPMKFTLSFHPIAKDLDLEQPPEPDFDPMTHSMYGTFAAQEPEDKGPFSSKRVVHESDTPHSKHQQDDQEEMVIPGDKQEINEFIEIATNSARIQIELQIPVLHLILPTKHLYEVIYNRINSDLLLWEPCAPKPRTATLDGSLGFGSNFNNLASETEMFQMCKSGINYDTDSEDDDYNVESSGVYHSVYDRSMRQSSKPYGQVKNNGQSAVALNLNIDYGILLMHPPCRDSSSNVIPGQRGNCVISVEKGKLCSISGYKGDDALGYVCFTGHTMKLLHNGMATIPTSCSEECLNEKSDSKTNLIYDTIYKADSGVLLDDCNHGGERDMVSVAVRIQASHETHHVKTVRVAVGINKATLRHRIVQEPNSWIGQLIDMFNVLDYPIPGYTAKDVLTELHLHLWDCAIDYRPIHLPLRTVATIGSFSMSSHLSAVANTSTLRFIAEECALFLSDKPIIKNIVNLRKDYVCVLDFGLFEVSLKTNDKKSGINPHIDLRASNNIIHIRTCSDSGRALMQLLTYFASDGDLLSNENAAPSNSTYSSPRHQVDEELVSVEPQNISNLSPSQQQHIQNLIGDAMEEETIVLEETKLEEYTPLGARMFFFPDEKHPIPDTMKPIPQVTHELGDATFRSSRSSDTDEEFCFIGDEPGLGILSKSGIPEVRWMDDDCVYFGESFFIEPVGKSDQLKPPKIFPTPLMRYTLCDMSLVWHMYGGSDFKTDPPPKTSKKVNFSDMRLRDGVGFSNRDTGEVIFSTFEKSKNPNMPWYLRGGINRDHNVLMELQLNKVKFTHEIYPEHTKQASRQVLLVTELEIRDKLECSQINKFLYQYTSTARPKQSHAHMIVIKAVHIRPDSQLKSQECCLKISLLPLRLNIDQDSLLFLINFFSELSGSTTSTDENLPVVSSKHSTPTHQPPILSVSVDEKEVVQKIHEAVDENLLLLMDKEEQMGKDDSSSTKTLAGSSEDVPIYFRSVSFGPNVPIRLDYQGKRVDMKHGPLPGLLMGLAQLNCSELCLKRIVNRHGILGFDKLLNYMLQEWLNDIKKNQLPSLLGGIGPMHALVQLFQGIRDLFWLPIEQYQKDGRIVRGLQRGANSFTTSTAMAALELTSRILHLIQITAETAYDMMSPGPSVRKRNRSKGRKKRYSQPQDIREGVAAAYNVVREGIGETADNIVRVASHEHEQKGYSGAFGGVLRQIPPTLVKPIIVASEATNNVLGGMRSQLVPDARREANEKWRSDDR